MPNSGFGIISPDGDTVQTFEPAARSPSSAGAEYSNPQAVLTAEPSSDEPEDYYTADTTSTDGDDETHPSRSLHASDTLLTTAMAAENFGSAPVTAATTATGTSTMGIHILPRLPKLARSASLPVPSSHLAHLDPPLSPFTPMSPNSSLSPSTPSSYDEVSRELADSVQAMVQTLLHLAPPHILDPVKELYSACTVQLPTPSVSALLTTMKNLNYLSANLRSLDDNEGDGDVLPDNGEEGTTGAEGERVKDNFDIGEVVQSVGDVLSGLAAKVGVDLAIFHGDVGMRHINVMGDERSILFILTHVSISFSFLETRLDASWTSI